MNFITRIILLFSSLFSISLAFTASTRFNAAVITTRFFGADGNAPYFYDMGIGKNQPFHTDIRNDEHAFYTDDTSEGDVYEAAQFMAQYESTHRFPSPLDRSSSFEQRIQQHQAITTHQSKTGKSEGAKIKNNKRNSLPKVQLKRQLEDVLYIVTEARAPYGKLASTSHSHPVMIQPSRRSQQIDINSVWVEMLIHDQQNIAALQGA